jgi:hypothetical protein
MESNKASPDRRTTSLPLNEAQERAREFNAIILGEYKKASEKVLLRCLNCQNEWSKSIASLSFSRVGCPVCALQKSANDRRKSEPEVAEILSNLGIDYLGGYTSSHSTLAVKFRACGHTSTDQRFSVLRRGFGCAICYHVNLNDYLSLAEQYEGSLLSAGTNSTSLSTWRCVNGCVFKRSYASIKAAKNFCSICSKGISERICQVAFSQIFGVKFKKVKLTDLRGDRGGVLEFDLYAEIIL